MIKSTRNHNDQETIDYTLSGKSILRKLSLRKLRYNGIGLLALNTITLKSRLRAHTMSISLAWVNKAYMPHATPTVCRMFY